MPHGLQPVIDASEFISRVYRTLTFVFLLGAVISVFSFVYGFAFWKVALVFGLLSVSFLFHKCREEALFNEITDDSQ